jgi:hypothetical protein
MVKGLHRIATLMLTDMLLLSDKFCAAVSEGNGKFDLSWGHAILHRL